MAPLVTPFGTRRSGYRGRKPGRRVATGGSGGGEPTPSPPSPVDWFVANASAGAGDGSTVNDPFQFSDLWSVVSAGEIVQVASGTYQGANNMIQPPATVNGTSGNPITIIAETAGGPLIDGQGTTDPITIDGNRFLIVENVFAKMGHRACVRLLGGATNNAIRKVMAWDQGFNGGAWDQNGAVFDVTFSWGNLLEDCGAFGYGRRMYNLASSGDGVTTRPSNVLRRCWGRGTYLEKKTKKVFQVGYQGYNDIVENCIGTFDAEGITSQVEAWRGIFCFGRVDHQAPVNSNSKILASIAYVMSGSDAAIVLDQLADGFGPNAGGNEFRDVLFYTAVNTNNLKIVRLQDYDGDDGAYTDATEIGDAGGSSSIAVSWVVTDREVHSTVAAATSAGATPFSATRGEGAWVLKRTVDGVETGDDLWPWPTDDLLRTAITASGRDPDEIFGGTDATLTDLIGSIFNVSLN